MCGRDIDLNKKGVSISRKPENLAKPIAPETSPLHHSRLAFHCGHSKNLSANVRIVAPYFSVGFVGAECSGISLGWDIGSLIVAGGFAGTGAEIWGATVATGDANGGGA